MIVLPAVDIKDGRAVRLRQGKANETTVFSPDPVAAARAWERQGARYLHVVDLDGAFDGEPKSRNIVKDICLPRVRRDPPYHRNHGSHGSASLPKALRYVPRAHWRLS